MAAVAFCELSLILNLYPLSMAVEFCLVRHDEKPKRLTEKIGALNKKNWALYQKRPT